MKCHIILLALVVALTTPAVAFAGMPSLDLTDVARMRIETLSFFLVVFLACGKGLQVLWNWLRNHFARMPRLSYCKSLGLLTVGGLLFVVVLTMISGVRELLTPGTARTRARANKTNMMSIALALHNHHSTSGYFPPGFTFDMRGQPLHGWQTSLLPYLEQDTLFNQIQLDRPWDDEVHRAAFFREIREYTSPNIGPQFDADGYSLSHYAGNSHAFPGSEKKGLRISDFKNGVSSTILFGEVSAGFRPWGHPLNIRDPARGLGSAVDRFGGPWPNGQTHFMFGDGSVRSVSPNISPAVLKGWADPAAR